MEGANVPSQCPNCGNKWEVAEKPLKDTLKDASIDLGSKYAETWGVGTILAAIASQFATGGVTGAAAGIWALYYIKRNYDWYSKSHSEVTRGFSVEGKDKVQCYDCGIIEF